MSKPAYGRYHAPDPPSALLQLHVHDGTTPLKTVDHETPLAVLDQSDLVEQRIHTTRFIPGCRQDADALGSCTANTVIEDLAQKLTLERFIEACKTLIRSTYAEHPEHYGDAAAAERAAIAFYFQCTHQTGDPAQEWPPTDCGSSGPFMYSELIRHGFISGQKIAAAGDSLISLLQSGTVAIGGPFFYAWEEPDAHGFIDGQGRPSDLEAALASGLAGGHETLGVAVEKVVVLPTGHVDAANTVLRVRNHWTRPWGDNGCYRVHLSTLVMLGGQFDFRQFNV